MRVGIAGSGLLGRLTAQTCLNLGFKVHLFDKDSILGENSCGLAAAGMIAPFTELEAAEPIICTLGLDSLALWPSILKTLQIPIGLNQNGTVILAHPHDKLDLERLLSRIDYKLKAGGTHAFSDVIKPLDKHTLCTQIKGLSPDLTDGYWVANEGHIDTTLFYQATTKALQESDTVWHEHCTVEHVAPFKLRANGKWHEFDLVFDCRGLGAKHDLPTLRGVRGEVLILQAKEVHLPCPVRIVHPRYPIYICPRQDHHFVIGATAIESEDTSPISAQSMLELLSACYVVHPGFSEARLIKSLTQCRPTLPDSHPQVTVTNGLIRLNGLYRHGYLAGPAVVADAFTYLLHGLNAVKYPHLFVQEKEHTTCTL